MEQDCLVAVCAKHFIFYWKDESVEKLAPLRYALLETFGSYDRAWLFLTRHLPIPVDKVGDHFQEILDKAEELPEARCRSWRISSGVFGR